MPASRPPIALPKSYNDLPFTQIKTEHYEKDASVIILTLYRPKNHNAFTDTMRKEIEDAYAMFDVDDRVKCIVFTGTGKIFCAGADLDVGFIGGREPINEHRDGYVCNTWITQTSCTSFFSLFFLVLIQLDSKPRSEACREGKFGRLVGLDANVDCTEEAK